MDGLKTASGLIHIKVDKEVKEGAKESDIDKLLHLIDQTAFIGFRDAAAIKLMYKTALGNYYDVSGIESQNKVVV